MNRSKFLTMRLLPLAYLQAQMTRMMTTRTSATYGPVTSLPSTYGSACKRNGALAVWAVLPGLTMQALAFICAMLLASSAKKCQNYLTRFKPWSAQRWKSGQQNETKPWPTM